MTAGTVNYEGPITVEARSTGSDGTLAGIGRLVAEAQSREAPIQRVADSVAGNFCYGVMAASAATFAFWQLAGAWPSITGTEGTGCRRIFSMVNAVIITFCSVVVECLLS